MHTIAKIIEHHGAIPVGRTVVAEPINLRDGDVLRGLGRASVIEASGDFPVVITSAKHGCTIQDVELRGGSCGIHVDGGAHVHGNNVFVTGAKEHGVLVTGGSWCNYWSQCTFKRNGKSGYHSVGTEAGQNGNNTAFTQCLFWANGESGLEWAAAGLSLSGCLFEMNKKHGLLVDGRKRNALGVDVAGCYFETNTTELRLVGKRGSGVVYSVAVRGSYFYNARQNTVIIKADGDYNTVRCLRFDRTNYLYSPSEEWVDLGAAAKQCLIERIGPRSRYKISDGNTLIDLLEPQPSTI